MANPTNDARTNALGRKQFSNIKSRISRGQPTRSALADHVTHGKESKKRSRGFAEPMDQRDAKKARHIPHANFIAEPSDMKTSTTIEAQLAVTAAPQPAELITTITMTPSLANFTVPMVLTAPRSDLEKEHAAKMAAKAALIAARARAKLQAHDPSKSPSTPSPPKHDSSAASISSSSPEQSAESLSQSSVKRSFTNVNAPEQQEAKKPRPDPAQGSPEESEEPKEPELPEPKFIPYGDYSVPILHADTIIHRDERLLNNPSLFLRDEAVRLLDRRMGDTPKKEAPKKQYIKTAVAAQDAITTDAASPAMSKDAASPTVSKDAAPNSGAPQAVLEDAAPKAELKQDGATKDEPKQVGSTNVAPKQDGATKVEPTQDGTTTVVPHQDGAARVTPTQNGAAKAAPKQDGALNVESKRVPTFKAAPKQSTAFGYLGKKKIPEKPKRGFLPQDLGRPDAPKKGPTVIVNDCDLWLHNGQVHIATEQGLLLASTYLTLGGIPDTTRVRFEGTKPKWLQELHARRNMRQISRVCEQTGMGILYCSPGDVVEVYDEPWEVVNGYAWGRKVAANPNEEEPGWIPVDALVHVMDEVEMSEFEDDFIDDSDPWLTDHMRRQMRLPPYGSKIRFTPKVDKKVDIEQPKKAEVKQPTTPAPPKEAQTPVGCLPPPVSEEIGKPAGKSSEPPAPAKKTPSPRYVAPQVHCTEDEVDWEDDEL